MRRAFTVQLAPRPPRRRLPAVAGVAALGAAMGESMKAATIAVGEMQEKMARMGGVNTLRPTCPQCSSLACDSQDVLLPLTQGAALAGRRRKSIKLWKCEDHGWYERKDPT